MYTRCIYYNETLRTLKQFTQSKLNAATEFRIHPIDETAVFTMLQKLNINKSSGADCLGPRLLKLTAPVISKSVAQMINQSITLKIAKVIPIYKKGERSDPGNYRPISILPTLSKIYERHVASQIHNYLSAFELLHVEQSGFRQFHSCQTALTKLVNTWLEEMDNGNITGVSFLHFRKVTIYLLTNLNAIIFTAR